MNTFKTLDEVMGPVLTDIKRTREKDRLENLELAVSGVESCINDMNETSQELDELWSKLSTVEIILERTQKRFINRIATLKRYIEDVKDLL
jgi:hypothetical protein|tara:strand:- start:2 stop:274 length:273 start_codon:yes stop_codon:yes gene_type:complete